MALIFAIEAVGIMKYVSAMPKGIDKWCEAWVVSLSSWNADVLTGL